MSDKSHFAICDLLGGSSIGVMCGIVVGAFSYLHVPMTTLTVFSLGALLLFGLGGILCNWYSYLGASIGTFTLNYSALWADVWLHFVLGSLLLIITIMGCLYKIMTYHSKDFDEDDLF